MKHSPSFLPTAALAAALLGGIVAAPPTPALAEDKAEITESSTSLTESAGTLYVTTVGTIRNTTDESKSNVFVEVRHFDGDGKLVDVTISSWYSLSVAGNDTAAFRVQAIAATTRDRYASHKARILPSTYSSSDCDDEEDEDYAGGTTSGGKDFWIEALVQWGPMLLLVGVWLFFMRRMNGKTSPGGRMVELYEKQIALVEAQNRVLERIAGAAERQREQPPA